ncbi:hypothetical protein KC221_22865, partial [Mycobacterium tuberculosis]|nr:hypothetical protein [Mycobacterium tuberculosis]
AVVGAAAAALVMPRSMQGRVPVPGVWVRYRVCFDAAGGSRRFDGWAGQALANREDANVVTIAQLRAVLAILLVDPQESVAAHRDPASEQAELVGLLH